MRLFMDVVIAVMLAALLLGVIWHTRNDQSFQQARETTRAEVRRFQQQIALQSTLAQVPLNDRGYPEKVNPNWFKDSLPNNTLLLGAHPWLEIAGPEDKDLVHPQHRVASGTHIAKFWYNPNTGTVRARVPSGIPDDVALDLYNHVNECRLPELFADGSITD